jgi:hypothetical protein
MKFALSLLISCLSVFSFGHNYYVSIANMEYKEAENQVDVSLKMTAHDFEYLLEMKYNQRLHIENIADSSEIGRYIQVYLAENFVLISGGDTAMLNYVGKEVTLRDELFFYFSFTHIRDPKTIQIKNQLLFTLFTQQQNIVHYKYGEKTKSVTLVPSAHSAEIKID